MSFPYATASPTRYDSNFPQDMPLHFRQQYGNYVRDLAQQKASRARGLFEESDIRGEEIIFDFSAPSDMDERTSRYDDTNYSEPAEERRSMRVALFEKAFLVEKHVDPLRMVEDPENIYVRKLGFAAGRKWDDVIFAAAFADVRTGKTGNSTVSWSEANSDCRIITSTQIGGLTLNALIESSVYLDEAEYIDESEERYIFLPPRAIGDLLKDDKVPSADYNSVRALVNGQINSFFGFRFVKTNRLPLTDDGQYYRAFACVKSALVVANSDLDINIAPDPGKNFNTCVHGSMQMGALRCQEDALVEIRLPKETGSFDLSD